MEVISDMWPASRVLGADWEFVKGLLRFVIYGGRIENDFDMTVLLAYLELFFNDKKITGKDGQQVAERIDIIASQEEKDYVTLVEKQVPNEDDPSLFGLPANIRFSWQLSEAHNTLTQLRRVGVASSSPTADWPVVMGPALQLWRRLCAGTDLTNKKPIDIPEVEDPLMEVLILETNNGLGLIGTIHRDLSKINRCLKGTEVPDPAATGIVDAFRLQQTPGFWEDLWDGPKDPLEYLTMAVEATKSTLEMSSNATRLLDSPVFLSKLLRPTVFLNAVRQISSRKSGIGMDELRLISAWEQSKLRNVSVAFSIQGLVIQGALLDSTQLRPTTSSSPPTSNVPLLHLAWVPQDAPPPYSPDSSIEVYL